MILCTYHIFFDKFHMTYASQPPQILWHTSFSNLGDIVSFGAFLNSLETKYFCKIRIIFAMNQLHTIQILDIWIEIIKK